MSSKLALADFQRSSGFYLIVTYPMSPDTRILCAPVFFPNFSQQAVSAAATKEKL